MWTIEAFDAMDARAAARALAPCCASGAWIEEVAAGRPYGSAAALKAAAMRAFDALDEAELAAAHDAHPPIGAPREAKASVEARTAAVDLAGTRPASGGRTVEARTESLDGVRTDSAGSGSGPEGTGTTGRGSAGTGAADSAALDIGSAHPESTEAAWSRDEQSGARDADAAVRAALAEAGEDYRRRFGRVFLICATGLSAEDMLAAARRRLDNDEAAERAEARAELRKIVALRLDKAFGTEAP